MEERNYVAIYREGIDKPMGAVRSYKIAEGVLSIFGNTGSKLYAMPITKKEAEEIGIKFTMDSERRLEQLLRKARGEK